MRVLDVGCGLGALSAAAAARGAVVTGVDLAEGMLAEARRRHPDVEFVHADAEALPFADGAFDVALGAFIVNHLPHAERAAAELARVARRVALADVGPGGRGRRSSACPPAPPRDLAADVPPGPDALRFTDRQQLAACSAAHRHRAPPTLHVDTLDELWDGVRGGTVRTAARLAAATPAQLAAARAASPRSPSRTAPRRATTSRPRSASPQPKDALTPFR